MFSGRDYSRVAKTGKAAALPKTDTVYIGCEILFSESNNAAITRIMVIAPRHCVY
jgi:hypothetical protein